MLPRLPFSLAWVLDSNFPRVGLLDQRVVCFRTSPLWAESFSVGPKCLVWAHLSFINTQLGLLWAQSRPNPLWSNLHPHRFSVFIWKIYLGRLIKTIFRHKIQKFVLCTHLSPSCDSPHRPFLTRPSQRPPLQISPHLWEANPPPPKHQPLQNLPSIPMNPYCGWHQTMWERERTKPSFYCAVMWIVH